MAKNRINTELAYTDGETVSFKDLSPETKKRKFALINKIDALFVNFDNELYRLKIESLERFLDII